MEDKLDLSPESDPSGPLKKGTELCLMRLLLILTILTLRADVGDDSCKTRGSRILASAIPA